MSAAGTPHQRRGGEAFPQVRVGYPDPTITHRRHEFACPSWCILEHDGEEWGTPRIRFGRAQSSGATVRALHTGAEQTLEGNRTVWRGSSNPGT
jgi:hypothetical protein